MNCDRIAPFYRFVERAAFRGRLQKQRLAFVAAAEGKRRALILGDGDGRFAEALSIQYPDLEIDSVELSAGMVAEARKRVPARPNLRIIQGDAFLFLFPDGAYDVIFTHFFLDCFSTAKVTALAAHISARLPARADWIISDFRQARYGWRELYTAAWLASMYLFFRFATGLETRNLPEYSSALEAAGFRKREEQISSDGLLVSEWWQRSCLGEPENVFTEPS